MKTSLFSVEIEIPHDTAGAILCHPEPLVAYRDYLREHYSIVPSSINSFDVERLQERFASELGAIELAAMRQRTRLDQDLTLLKAAQ